MGGYRYFGDGININRDLENSGMNINRLTRTIERHEGFRSKPYRCTSSKLTIGIGRNLDDVGIRYSEAKFMLKNDLEECRLDLRKIFPQQLDSLPDYVQEVLMNMRFQLGSRGFRGFKKLIGAVHGWDFELAAIEMLVSRWARQTPERANELAGVMRHGFGKVY